MKDSELNSVEDGLNRLIARYKKNSDTKDAVRLSAALDAKKALRKIILIVAVTGNLQSIKPIFSKKQGAGWEIIDHAGRLKKFFKT